MTGWFSEGCVCWLIRTWILVRWALSVTLCPWVSYFYLPIFLISKMELIWIFILEQWSSAFLAPGTCLWKTIFPGAKGQGGWFQYDSSALPLLCTLFLGLLHELHLRSSGIRAEVGEPSLQYPVCVRRTGRWTFSFCLWSWALVLIPGVIS